MSKDYKKINEQESHLNHIKEIKQGNRTKEYFAQTIEQNQLIMESATEGILVLDLKGNHTFCNQAAANLLGFTNEELLNSHDHSLLHHTKSDGNPYPEEECPIYNTIRSGEKHRISTDVFWRKDGTNFAVEYTSAPIYEHEMLIGAVVIFHDITERKRTALALQESEEKFRMIMENSADAIFITNQQGKYVYTNKAVSALLGFTSEEMENKTITDILPPNKLDGYFDFFKKVLIEGKGFTEIELLKKDGDYISTDLNAIVLPDGNVYISCRDITERKHTEKDILRFKQGIDRTSDAVFITNPEGDITYANSAFEKVYGYTLKETIGRTPRILKSDVLSQEVYKSFWATLLNNKIVSGEIVNKTKDGRLITVYGSNNPISDATGNIIGFLGIHRDITERKKMEEALLAAKEKAEESDRLKSAFLANMSHEIRTPMNGILGFAELLKEPDLTGAQQQNYISVIEKSGARMLNIINNIIDISKLEAGLMKLDIKETNINELIEYIYTFFKPEVEAKGMKLSFNTPLPAKEATIATDREKVYAILTNLVKNAIKYSNEGTIEIGYVSTVSTTAPVSESIELEFYVKDSGIGIPQDRQEAIFERFIQADITDAMAKQGAGLGLSITKAYIEMLGGKIWVESEEGVGSTFYFTLPYNAEPVKETVAQEFETSDETNQVRKLKILIAEDDEVSEMLLSQTIKMFGKEILKAKTGVDAVETCKNNSDIDLVLMDIRMPEMNGYEATHQIRKFNKELVIIAQTAYGLTGDREKAIEAGCNDYISKPINKNELLTLIQKYFGE